MDEGTPLSDRDLGDKPRRIISCSLKSTNFLNRVSSAKRSEQLRGHTSPDFVPGALTPWFNFLKIPLRITMFWTRDLRDLLGKCGHFFYSLPASGCINTLAISSQASHAC